MLCLNENTPLIMAASLTAVIMFIVGGSLWGSGSDSGDANRTNIGIGLFISSLCVGVLAGVGCWCNTCYCTPERRSRTARRLHGFARFGSGVAVGLEAGGNADASRSSSFKSLRDSRRSSRSNGRLQQQQQQQQSHHPLPKLPDSDGCQVNEQFSMFDEQPAPADGTAAAAAAAAAAVEEQASTSVAVADNHHENHHDNHHDSNHDNGDDDDDHSSNRSHQHCMKQEERDKEEVAGERKETGDGEEVGSEVDVLTAAL